MSYRLRPTPDRRSPAREASVAPVGRRTVRFVFVGLLLLLGLCLRAGTAAAAAPPDHGPGGPILVITNSASPFSGYYAEILRAEGLNEFTVTDI